MGVSISEVVYTLAMPRREDHEVHKKTCGGIGKRKQFNTLKTKVPLSENNVIQITTIPLQTFGKLLANITHYSLKHLRMNSCDFLLNSTFQLLNCVGCWSFEGLRFQIPPENGVDFFQWPLSLPQYSRVYVLFLHYHLSSLVWNQ